MRALQTKLGDWGKQGPAVRASASEQRSALQAELRLRRILRLASGTLHAGPLQCAEISRGRPLQTLSSPCLHRQLVALGRRRHLERADDPAQETVVVGDRRQLDQPLHAVTLGERVEGRLVRSEEHTSELQSRENLVCSLLLEKKKKKITRTVYINNKNIMRRKVNITKRF